jgi:Co/Zn/Cd efflux system component
MSIALEALGRVIAPPEISNPKVIVVVGSLGLLSNIVGLFLFHGTSKIILLQIMSELIFRTWTFSWSLSWWRSYQVAG